jgi:pimeloyl-ACP methyl ester carboxylesterase
MPPTTQPTLQCPATQFYDWRGYRCAYELWPSELPEGQPKQPPILLIHPIGVGLSRRFWTRWIAAWRAASQTQAIYNPDLLGCGESAMPRLAYQPNDWADQLAHLIKTLIQQPVILLVQGASFPVAIELMQAHPELVKAVVLSGPPAWTLITQATPSWQHQLAWNLFDSPLGQSFYQYAKRRQFIASFSVRQLFAQATDVDAEWLDRLTRDGQVNASRYAVFSFLAGFWRQDYSQAMASFKAPTLVLLGNIASSISRAGKAETPEQRMADYLKHLPRAEGRQITGRNVLPYEATQAFVEAMLPFVREQESV